MIIAQTGICSSLYSRFVNLVYIWSTHFEICFVLYTYINIKIMHYINVQTDAITHLLLAFPSPVPRIVLSKYT